MADPAPYPTDPNAPPPAYPPAAYPPQAQPQQPPPTTVVVTQQPVQAVVFRDVPVMVTDSKGQQVQTQVEFRSGALVWVIAFLLFFFGFWCCCCIPFCIDAFKDVYHISPTDGSVVGVYKRI